MTKFRTLLLLALGLLAAATAAQAHDYTLGALKIGHPWARATAPTAPAGGGFLTVTNTGTTPDRLISARSAAAGLVQIHEMKMEGDVMRMRPAGAIDLPVGRAFELKPGSYHVMLQELKQPLAAGSAMPLTLVFRNAKGVESRTELRVPVSAQPPAGAAAGAAHDHKH